MRSGLCGLSLFAALACAGPFGKPSIPIDSELSPEQKAEADKLASAVTDGAFAEEIAKDCAKNARSFAWIAATHGDPGVVSAALRAGGGCADDPAVDPATLSDLGRATAGRLTDPDPAIVLSAFAAADSIIAPLPPEHPLITALVSLASASDPAVRYEALVTLDRRAWTQEPVVAAVFLKALDDTENPWLVTEVLRRLRYRASGLVGQGGQPSPPFRSAAMLLTQDLDPGIRGRAALVLARLAPTDPDVIETLMRMLGDSHGFVRSAAAEALSETGHREAIAAIISRIDDPAKNTWDMLPFTRLDGTREVPHHVGSLYERVDDAYLRAIAALSVPMGENAFVCREISMRYRDLDIIAATRDAKQWYAKNFPSEVDPKAPKRKG